KPGATTLPPASISTAPLPITEPISVILPSLTAISPGKGAPPPPSTINAFRMTSECAMPTLPGPRLLFSIENVLFNMENNAGHGKVKDISQSHGKPVGAVRATLNVVRHAARATEPFSLADLVKAIGLNRSTAFNISKTLVQEGVLAFDPTSKVYKLTP